MGTLPEAIVVDVPDYTGEKFYKEESDKTESDKKKESYKIERDWKQILIDLIICTENLSIVLVAYFQSQLGIPTELLEAVLLIHFAGLLLMVEIHTLIHFQCTITMKIIV